MDVNAAAGKGEEDSAEAEKSALAGKHHLSLMLMCCSTKPVLKNHVLSSLLLHCVLHCTGKHGGDNCSSKPGPELLGKSSRPHPLLFEVSAVAKVFDHF